MATISIPKKQYNELVDKALRYEYLRQIMKENIFASPPVRDTKKIIKSFKETGKYNQKFLQSLEKGLKRSLYFK
ncbi:hypothetical protein AMJ49_05080 [Parcubacteria bacterium DG_74_2]|nr:MAG: hypothetical protein AMJ49_05080 [Parcubacteria bacterium DG_74_2]